VSGDLLARALDAHLNGRLAEAERLYEEVLATEARQPAALTNLGALKLQQGLLEEGVSLTERSLALQANQPTALANLAAALDRLNRPEALAAYDRALILSPGNLTLLHGRAMLLYRLERLPEAAAAMRRVIEAAPQAYDALTDLGIMLDRIGDHDGALDAYGRALILAPAYAPARANQALSLHQVRRFAEALDAHDAVLALTPDDAHAWSNRGATLAALGRVEEALEAHEKALSLAPALVEAHIRRADMLGYLGRLDDALAGYAAALTLDAGAVKARWHPAMPLLRHGRYAEGQQAYEARWDGPLKASRVDMPQPLWLGGEDIAGETLLVHAEQGHGDTLMMLRFAPVLAARGATVILNVQEPLESLAAATAGVSAVIPYGHPLPAFDRRIPAMSLPLALGVTPQTVPAPPYLQAPAASRLAWRARLGARSRPRVGLAWAGSPAQSDDHYRSLALAQLSPLLTLDADFYALQVGLPGRDRATLAASRLIDLGPQLQTYADTAAVMEELDLIVSVCTSTANLAGALGRPLLVLLPAVADWRWGLGETSPWYPQARLFRQDRLGEWETPIARLRAAAEMIVASDPRR
jgi:tetratricopeptide (TPR) repeat protein